MDLEAVVNRVQADFREFPGMRLTAKQARRLWEVDDHVLEALVRRGVLRRHANGTISRASQSHSASHISAPASQSL